MKYPKEWKGVVKVSPEGIVSKRGLNIGKVVGSYKAGVRSPGGMVTNTVWRAYSFDGEDLGLFLSKTLAVEELVK